MKLNKIIMIGLFIVLLVVGISICVNAESYSGTCGSDVTWSLDTSAGILNISGTGDMEDYTSSSDVPWNSYVSSIKYIIISDGVTSIGDYAFENCSNLITISVPGGIRKFGDYAFYGCDKLSSITIPDGVTSIGVRTFYNCNKLTSITIPDSVVSIGSSALYGCTGITNIEIPNSVTSMGNSVFYGCTGLTNIEIPSSVTSMGNSVFYGCTGLTSITLPDNITTIDGYVFYGCTGITNIEIPNSVTSIGNYAFYGCTGLTSITIPNSVTTIGSSSFEGCSNLAIIAIPDGITSIGSGVFRDCTSLKSIKIPSNVTIINDYTFYNCESLKNITIPSGVTSIGTYAFYGCKRLTSISIPYGVTSIKKSTFSNCNYLKSITIPSSVTTIASYAFYNCYSLKTVRYSGYKSEWNKIEIMTPENTYLTSADLICKIQTLTASASVGGKIQYNGADFTSCEIDDSTVMTLTFVPDEGYELTSVKVNGGELIALVNNNQLTIGGYEEDALMEANFAPIEPTSPYTKLSSSIPGLYSILVSTESGEVPTTVYELHNSVVCYVSGFKGTSEYTLTGWGINIKSVGKDTTLTLPADLEMGVSNTEKFAVRVFGKGMEIGSYELSTYVTYTDENGEEITDVSEKQEVTLN